MPIPTNMPTQDRLLLRDRVRNQIKAAIEDGTLEPGERLNDDELIAWLGVSRTPIREALSDLGRAGLVEMSPNRYTRVAIPDPKAAIAVLQTLGVIFGGVVRLAVSNLDAPVKKRALAGIDTCIKNLASRDAAALNSNTVALFDLFVEHCGNPSLTKLSRDVQDGLAFQLRVPNFIDDLDAEKTDLHFRELRTAVESEDAIAAELATEAMHHLPLTPR